MIKKPYRKPQLFLEGIYFRDSEKKTVAIIKYKKTLVPTGKILEVREVRWL